MKWIEKHWILAIVIVAAVVYLYSQYGNQLLANVSNNPNLTTSPNQG